MTTTLPLLDAEGAVAFLRSENLLESRRVLESGLRVEDLSGRHRNFRVTLGDGTGFIVKQADDSAAAAALAVEAAFCIGAHEHTDRAALRAHVPQCLRHDASRGILVTELVPGARHPLDFDDVEGEAHIPRVGALLGRVLGALHAIRNTDGVADPPWILDIATPAPDWLDELSAAHLEIIRQLQRDAATAETLAAMRSAWAPDAVIHRDVKWSNVLVARGPGSPTVDHLWLVDWELAGPGDSAWDVGSAFHSHLADAMHLAAGDATSAVDLATRFAGRLPAAQAEVAAFWSAYVAARPLAPRAHRDFLRRATLATGARLLQSAYEWSHGRLTVERSAAAAVQLALNVLRDPDQALRGLLGFAPVGGE